VETTVEAVASAAEARAAAAPGMGTVVSGFPVALSMTTPFSGGKTQSGSHT